MNDWNFAVTPDEPTSDMVRERLILWSPCPSYTGKWALTALEKYRINLNNWRIVVYSRGTYTVWKTNDRPSSTFMVEMVASGSLLVASANDSNILCGSGSVAFNNLPTGSGCDI